MSFNAIVIVYGVPVDRDTFFIMFGSELGSYAHDYLERNPAAEDVETDEPEGFEAELCEAMNIMNADLAWEIYGDFIQSHPNVFAYKCCSKLADERWIVGIKLAEFELDEMFHSMASIDPLNGCPAGWAELWAKYGINVSPKIYHLLDDCTSCR